MRKMKRGKDKSLVVCKINVALFLVKSESIQDCCEKVGPPPYQSLGPTLGKTTRSTSTDEIFHTLPYFIIVIYPSDIGVSRVPSFWRETTQYRTSANPRVRALRVMTC